MMKRIASLKKGRFLFEALVSLIIYIIKGKLHPLHQRQNVRHNLNAKLPILQVFVNRKLKHRRFRDDGNVCNRGRYFSGSVVTRCAIRLKIHTYRIGEQSKID